MTPLQSLVAAGTKLWIDSVDPDLVRLNRAYGATGATSNPIIIADLLKTGRFDRQMRAFFDAGLDDEAVAWAMTDRLVKDAQDVFLDVWTSTGGDDGWVGFELDPLLEDWHQTKSGAERSAAYIELGKKWAAGHPNRMIRVPATPGGLGAVEELVAGGVAVTVTLIFGERQYVLARDAAYRGVQRRADRENVKTAYSVPVGRIDVYTDQRAPTLSTAAQGQVGVATAKRIWKMNHDFWADKGTTRKQEVVFTGTGTKTRRGGFPDPCMYVAALAGADVLSNPPGTVESVQNSGRTFARQIDRLPPAEVLADIDARVDPVKLEETLMSEGLAKYADPHKALIRLIGDKRAGTR